MDMDMGGMDDGIGSDTNHAIARSYWYILAGVTGLFAAIHLVQRFEARQRLKTSRNGFRQYPSRPKGWLSQAWATATAVLREASYPQFIVAAKGFRWATPLPLGRILLLGYWGVIIYFMVWNAVVNDVYYWERIGYRNAWVTITQLPLFYLLSMKFNVLGWLIGSSHERLNWLHRWVARIMLVTATVHGFYFWTEWENAGFVSYQLSIMPMVKYGIGAWAILLWSVVVGFLPIRRMAYETWLLQHIISFILILLLLYKHIPDNAKPFLCMTISFLAFDRALRWLCHLAEYALETKKITLSRDETYWSYLVGEGH